MESPANVALQLHYGKCKIQCFWSNALLIITICLLRSLLCLSVKTGCLAVLQRQHMTYHTGLKLITRQLIAIISGAQRDTSIRFFIRNWEKHMLKERFDIPSFPFLYCPQKCKKPTYSIIVSGTFRSLVHLKFIVYLKLHVGLCEFFCFLLQWNHPHFSLLSASCCCCSVPLQKLPPTFVWVLVHYPPAPPSALWRRMHCLRGMHLLGGRWHLQQKGKVSASLSSMMRPPSHQTWKTATCFSAQQASIHYLLQPYQGLAISPQKNIWLCHVPWEPGRGRQGWQSEWETGLIHQPAHPVKEVSGGSFPPPTSTQTNTTRHSQKPCF